jgi:hypothetical protein
MTKTVLALYDDFDVAQTAVEALVEAGSTATISVSWPTMWARSIPPRSSSLTTMT